MFKKVIAALILPMLVFGATNTGTTAGSFLKINTGARSAALGGAFSGLANDNEALSLNPAGIAQLTVPEFSGGHIIWFSDIAVEHLQFTMPLNSTMVLGISGVYVNNGTFEAYTASAVSAGSFTAYDALIGVSLGVKLTENIFAGITAKYVMTGIDTDSAAAYAGDGGMVIKNILPGISVGGSLQNIGTALKLYSISERLPRMLRLGFAFSPAPDAVITVDGLTYLTEGNYNISAGIELEIVPRSVTLRAGYMYPVNSTVIDFTSGVSAGLGFNFPPVSINYSIVPDGELGYAHRVSAGFALGEKKKAPPAEEKPAGPEPLPESVMIKLADAATAVTSEAVPVLPGTLPLKTAEKIVMLKPFVSKTMRESQQNSMFEIIKSNLLSSKSIKVFFSETSGINVDEVNAVVLITGAMEKSDDLIEISAVLRDPKTGKEITAFTSKAKSLIDVHMKTNELSKKIEQYISEYIKAK